MLSTAVLYDKQSYTVALTTIGTVFAVAVIRKLWRNMRKRRQLAAKIKAFHLAEQERRDEITARRDGSKHALILSLHFAELVQKLQNGELKATEVLHAYQRAALSQTEQTNAVTEFILERAEEQAAKLDKLPADERMPLHGIPVSVKECYFVPGTEATIGFSQLLGQCRNEEAAALVQFLEWLGCVPFVKTNIPQGVLSFDSRNAIYGITRNPHNLSKSPGGSSSGEGALVSAKASILGIGSDIGGSLRIPAAWCGCYTIKPTAERMLQGGSIAAQYCARIILRDLPSVGFVTQDVNTLVTLHRLLYSAETFRKFPMVSMAPIPFCEELFNSNGPSLTIGYCDYDGLIETTPAMKRAVKMAKEALEQRGHRLVQWRPPRLKEAIILYFQLMSVDGALDLIKALNEDIEVAYPNKIAFASLKTPFWIKKLLSIFARRFVGEFPAELMKELRPGTHPHDVNFAFRKLIAYREEFVNTFRSSSLNALLWPSFPCPAVPLDVPRDILAAVSYTALFNLLNWPAGVCPITKAQLNDEVLMISYPGDRDLFHRALKKANSEDTVGLPVSVQVAAPPYHEEVVLRLMAEISSSIKT